MASNAVNMELRKSPVVSFDFDKYCKDVPVKFNNKSGLSESGPVQFDWQFGNGQSSNVKSPTITYHAVQEYTVKLTITPELCPALVSSLENKISIEAPVEPLRYKLIDASVGNQVTLKARELPASVEWWPPTGLSDNHSKSPVLDPSKEQDFRIQYTFASGCTTVDSFLVRVFPSDYIYVPKAFTPNGDGRNDVLRPLNVGIKQLKYFRVYNRWGNLIFETTKMNEGWDGTHRGSKLASDTYVWSAEGIDQNGKLIRRSGSTTLIR